MANPTYAAFEQRLVSYKRSWRGSVFTSLVLPLMFLLSIGLTVGRYVDARSGSLGVPYLDFIAPGVLASTVLQVSVGEASWPVFDSFAWTRTYHAMRATPVTIDDILRGHLAYVLFRSTLAAVGFTVVMAAFGTLHSAWWPMVLPVSILLGLAVATPVFAFSAWVTNDGMFAVLFRFAVVPMTLFAAVFFEVTDLPSYVRVLAYVSPLWHGVELTRSATLGTPTPWGGWPHVAALVAWAVGGYLLARRRFAKKLAD